MISPLKCAAFPKIPPLGSAWHCGCIHAVTLSLAGGGFPESAQRNAADFRCESTFGGRSFRKAHGTVRRTAANFRAHGIALLAESNAVHNAEQCKKSGRTVSFSHKSVWEKERRLRRDFRYVVQYPFPAKACEMGAAIVTGFRAHNVSFLPQSKAEIQSLRRKTSGHA